MTLRAAEKISGLVITRHADNMYCGLGPDGEFWARGRDEKDAARRIVELHWKWVCDKVMRQANWKCQRCGRLRALQCHHIRFRSHGREDSVNNLTALCSECHERDHKNKRGLQAFANAIRPE